ncbi:peptide MFS transporter [Pontibacter qinzhouensis]|uniref:Peptide MFS transporter n=1 Tax=Pontibacter qinzhouensis TaxID=2603253 RepID=A0A5C8K970_9BACT|nr:peptide MFS transporter [Pontibacter qinzhouensis]TXK47670.1 peptide MFS transporter [Pontibacter qinzhouensis]
MSSEEYPINDQVSKHNIPYGARPTDVDSKHPRSLYMLFFTEMWERFSYYGMRALLTLYLITEVSAGGLGWSAADATQLYGIYTGLVYVTPVIGGYLADKYLGFRSAVFIGGIIIALGHGALAIEAMPSFYTGLGLLIIGTGFFKPNISSMVGQLYPEGSKLKDSAYTIFYMGINLGAFFGALICGYLGEKVGWHWGFGAAGIGMLLGLVQFYIGQNQLGSIGLKPAPVDKTKAVMPKEPLTKVERDRLIVILALSFFSILFWLAFEQAGSSMNIFAYKYTDRYIDFLDFEVPATWFQSVNSFFIFTLAPFFSMLWVFLSKKKLNPAGPYKFAIALVLLALGFVVLVVGASSIPKGAETAGVSMFWLVFAYMLHTMGELCLSPVGLSFVNKLSPLRLVGLMFGVWFGASAIGNYLGGALAGMIEYMSQTQTMSNFFLIFVSIAAVSALILFLFGKKLEKLMHGIK